MSIDTSNLSLPVLQLTPQNPLCFMHLPKTGGTTVRHFLASVLANEKFFQGAPNHCGPEWPLSLSDQYTVYLHHTDWRFWQGREIQPQCITVLRKPVERMISLYYFWRSKGFDDLDATTRVFLTPRFCIRRSFRDFVYGRSSGISAYMFNSQARQLTSGLHRHPQCSEEQLLEQVLTNLHDYALVGVIDQLDDFMRVLGVRLTGKEVQRPPRMNTNASLKQRFPNTYKEKPDALPDDVIQHIQRLNLVDTIIYEWAKKRWQEGGYQPSESLKDDLLDAGSRMAELKSQFGINGASSEYYSRGQSIFDYAGWTQAHHVVVDHSKITYREQTLRSGQKRVQGRKLFDIQLYADALEGKASDGRDLDNMLGYIDAARINRQVFEKRFGGRLTLIEPVDVVLWSHESVETPACDNVEFDPDNVARHQQAFDSLHRQFLAGLGGALHVERDMAYLRHRYFDHPKKAYIMRLISNSQTGEPLGLAVLTRMNGSTYLADFIGSFSALGTTVASLLDFFGGRLGSIHMALPVSVIERHAIEGQGRFNTDFYTVLDSTRFSTTDGAYITLGDDWSR